MRRLFSGLLLALAVSGTALASTYREASESLGEMATLNGRVVRFVDIEPEWRLPPGLQPRNPEALKSLIRDRALNGLREKALNQLAATLMPDCAVDATAADLEAFYPFWRTAITREAERRVAIGYDEDKGAEALAKAGMKTPVRISMTEMAKVDASMPGAEARARATIRNWKLDHCLQKTFGGDRFFSNMVGRDGQWPAGPQVAYWSVGDEATLLVPSLSLEPLTARGRFFRVAEAKGLLSFRSPADAAYFFQRYEGERYDTMKDDGAGLAFLSKAPWAP